jgi:hypothetical protein
MSPISVCCRLATMHTLKGYFLNNLYCGIHHTGEPQEISVRPGSSPKIQTRYPPNTNLGNSPADEKCERNLSFFNRHSLRHLYITMHPPPQTMSHCTYHATWEENSFNSAEKCSWNIWGKFLQESLSLSSCKHMNHCYETYHINAFH